MRQHLLTVAIAAAVFALALNAGGYALTTRNAVAIGVWWLIGLTVALSLLPLARPTRAAIVTGSALAGLAALSALSIAWSDSAERSFAEFNRVALYVGVFALAVLAGKRANARRWSLGLALGITATGVLALSSRLFPDLITEAGSLRFLPGGDDRLSYPLDYWNGLGIFVALAFPLLLGTATGARTTLGRGLAVAPLPALFATIYLTSSRGAAVTAIVGTVLFCILTARRGVALGTALATCAGSAVVVLTLGARDQLADGPFGSASAADQGESAALLIALACIGTAAIVALASRYGRLPSPALRRGPRAGLIALGVAALAVGTIAIDPVHRFETFKKPPDEFQAIETDFTRAHLLSGSGSGRWQFWAAAAEQFKDEPVLGQGAGSFEAHWARDGDLFRFIRDAHSLYLEMLGELGLIGFGLLALVLGSALLVAARRLWMSADEDRVLIASLTGVLVAWCVAAGIDWMWELTAVAVVAVVAVGLLTGPATAPPSPDDGTAVNRHGRRYLAVVFGVVALSLFVIGTQALPLMAQTRVRDSQVAVERGDAADALSSALDARDLQPWAASPQLQLALVREQLGDLPAARASILEAIGNDQTDWRLWLVRARLETKAGAFRPARQSLRRAEALNPRSPLFADRDANG